MKTHMRESLIKGGIPVLFATALLVCLDATTDAPVPTRLLDIGVANAGADLLIISVAFYSGIVRSDSLLLDWYTKYRLSAVLMDTLIGVIYMTTAYELVTWMGEDRLLPFGLISVAVQWVGDLMFYVVFTRVPRETNAVMDVFKDYAAEAQLGALLGDTFLVIVAVLVSSALALIDNERYVVYILIVILYLIPYVVHTRASDQIKGSPPVISVVAPARERTRPVLCRAVTSQAR